MVEIWKYLNSANLIKLEDASDKQKIKELELAANKNQLDKNKIFEIYKQIPFDLNLLKFIAGHSLGEYSALVCSEALDFQDAIYLLHERGKAMQELGADVIKVKGNYEKSLSECIKQSEKNNWQIVQDVAWENYMLVPTLTMAGYSVMMKEIVDQIKNESITHIFLQAGVGGMAGAMVAGVARYLKNIPKIIVIEPDSAACVMKSIESGKIEKVQIVRESLMGGMSCGEPSLVPWKILKKSVNNCISLPDDDIGKTMKLFANASFGDDKIIAGENAAPGVISLIACCNDEKIKNLIKLNSTSNVLLIGCEGDTDQEMYQKLLKD